MYRLLLLSLLCVAGCKSSSPPPPPPPPPGVHVSVPVPGGPNVNVNVQDARYGPPTVVEVPKVRQ
jgi:hypothetical protein